jgi:hypothetical protein
VGFVSEEHEEMVLCLSWMMIKTVIHGQEVLVLDQLISQL